MINLAKEAVLTAAPVAPATVEVEIDFYNRLINSAYKTFSNISFNYIKEEFITRLNKAVDTQDLVDMAQNFIDNREFITKVCNEKERIGEGY